MKSLFLQPDTHNFILMFLSFNFTYTFRFNIKSSFLKLLCTLLRLYEENHLQPLRLEFSESSSFPRILSHNFPFIVFCQQEQFPNLSTPTTTYPPPFYRFSTPRVWYMPRCLAHIPYFRIYVRTSARLGSLCRLPPPNRFPPNSPPPWRLDDNGGEGVVDTDSPFHTTVPHPLPPDRTLWDGISYPQLRRIYRL